MKSKRLKHFFFLISPSKQHCWLQVGKWWHFIPPCPNPQVKDDFKRVLIFNAIDLLGALVEKEKHWEREEKGKELKKK